MLAAEDLIYVAPDRLRSGPEVAEELRSGCPAGLATNPGQHSVVALNFEVEIVAEQPGKTPGSTPPHIPASRASATATFVFRLIRYVLSGVRLLALADVDDGTDELARRFLREVVADPSLDEAVLVLAAELVSESPAVIVDDHLHVVGVLEGRGTAGEIGIVKGSIRRSELPDQLAEFIPILFITSPSSLGREVNWYHQASSAFGGRGAFPLSGLLMR